MAAFMDPLPVTAGLDAFREEAEALARSGRQDAYAETAHRYGFRDWPALEAIVAQPPSFEVAVEAMVAGDLDTLRETLTSALIHARSPREHRATLLHYIAANGVEDCRQVTPPNAVEIARLLLDGGAEPDALAPMYGGECATLSLLVSSAPPADAGLQVPLAELLLDYGANPDGAGSGAWTSPLMTALAFSYRDAAEMLVRRGARRDRLAAAAGLGLLDEARTLLAAAGAEERHRALALAAQLGHVPIVDFLLEAGEDPNRYNPPGLHAHSTPLHQAAFAGHTDTVRVLLKHGASRDLRDRRWNGTPQGWAEYAGHQELARLLSQNEPEHV
jgi:ankyrin repeat protein